MHARQKERACSALLRHGTSQAPDARSRPINGTIHTTSWSRGQLSPGRAGAVARKCRPPARLPPPSSPGEARQQHPPRRGIIPGRRAGAGIAVPSQNHHRITRNQHHTPSPGNHDIWYHRTQPDEHVHGNACRWPERRRRREAAAATSARAAEQETGQVLCCLLPFVA